MIETLPCWWSPGSVQSANHRLGQTHGLKLGLLKGQAQSLNPWRKGWKIVPWAWDRRSRRTGSSQGRSWRRGAIVENVLCPQGLELWMCPLPYWLSNLQIQGEPWYLCLFIYTAATVLSVLTSTWWFPSSGRKCRRARYIACSSSRLMCCVSQGPCYWLPSLPERCWMTPPGDATPAPVHCPVLSWMAAPTNGELCAVCMSPAPWFTDYPVGKVWGSGGSAALSTHSIMPEAQCALPPGLTQLEFQYPMPERPE